ncbi:MAG TPA: PQQ-binding-like beta-propeller repeat protein [Kofleriaceae bacterium]|nr:PQQ-binding-like beta-propeller repeat protein [Kofleriaceae bacterium]
MPALRSGFCDFTLVRPPVPGGERAFAIQTEGAAIAFDRDGAIQWRAEVMGAVGPYRSNAACGVRGGALLVSGSDWWTALDPGSGEVRWRADLLADLLDNAAGPEQVWACVPGATGQGDWQIAEVSLADGSARPVATRPRSGVVVAATDRSLIVLEDHLIGLDRSDGRELWSTPLERPTSIRGDQSARADAYGRILRGRLLILRLVGFGLVAIDIDTGDIAWEADLQIGGFNALLAGDRLHVTTSWRFVEIDPDTGKVLSDDAITDPDVKRQTAAPGQFAHHAGVLYGAALDGTLFGWDLARRQVVWIHPLGVNVPWAGPPRALLGALWVVDLEGGLHSFELPPPS